MDLYWIAETVEEFKEGYGEGLAIEVAPEWWKVPTDEVIECEGLPWPDPSHRWKMDSHWIGAEGWDAIAETLWHGKYARQGGALMLAGGMEYLRFMERNERERERREREAVEELLGELFGWQKNVIKRIINKQSTEEGR